MSGWVDIAAGTGFCIAGIFLFQKYVFDRNEQLWKAVALLLLGIILITAGSVRNFK